jgi:hypothetical protein
MPENAIVRMAFSTTKGPWGTHATHIHTRGVLLPLDYQPPPMLLVRGEAGGTTLTGTLYERGEDAPQFKGAPDEEAPYVWVCDEFYEVESGGMIQRVGGQEVNVAFEAPMPRGFDTREQALEAAKDHVRTQFARIGVPERDVSLSVTQMDGDEYEERESSAER